MAVAAASPLFAAAADSPPGGPGSTRLPAGTPSDSPHTSPATRPAGEPFGYCLNTSTISGQNLGIVQELQIAAEAGFGGVEPWVRDLDVYVKGGG